MLQSLRKYAQTFVSLLFLIVLVTSFGLWGIADVFRGNVSDAVATVGGTDISSGELRKEYQDLLRRESADLRHQIGPDEARSLGLGQAAVNQLVTRAVLDKVIADMGITISDEEAAARIRGMREFVGPLGTFDKNAFLIAIERAGYTENSFIALERGDLAREQLLTPVAAGLVIPFDYVAAFLSAENERRAVEYVVVSSDNISPPAAPNDSTLAAYIKAHPEKFSTPEYRDVSYAYLGPDDMMTKVTVSPDQIRQEYESNLSTYVIPERRTLEQISFPSQSDASAARAKLDHGESFAQLAAERGIKPADLSLGDVAAQDLDKDRSQAAFSLPLNGVSQPIKGPFNWFLVHVTKITAGNSTSLEQATPAIRKTLATELANNALIDVSNKFQDALAGGADIAEAAQKSGMHFAHVAAIDQAGLGPDGKPTSAPNNAEFRAQIFKSEAGEPGDPFQAKDGNLFAVKVNGVSPPHLKAVDAVRAVAETGWMDEQRAKALLDRANELASRARSSLSLAPVVTALHGTLLKSPALSRVTADDTFSATLIRSIFDAGPGGIVVGPLGKGNGIVIARVTGIAHPQVPPGNAIAQRANGVLSEQIASDLTFSFASAAKVKQGSTINQKQVDQVVGGEGS
jgi:peptidyl-prolyl cis-trans isomerase D